MKTSEEFLALLEFSVKQLTCLAEKISYQVQSSFLLMKNF